MREEVKILFLLGMIAAVITAYIYILAGVDG